MALSRIVGLRAAFETREIRSLAEAIYNMSRIVGLRAAFETSEMKIDKRNGGEALMTAGGLAL